MPHRPVPADLAAAYWLPTLYRAVIAAAFGLASFFWVAPPVETLTWIFALFLVGCGMTVRQLAMLPETPAAAKGFWALTVVAWLVGAIVLVLVGGVGGLVWAAGAAWLVGALGQLAAWIRLRSSFAPARDWLIPAVVELGIGAGLMIFHLGGGLDAHGAFGIAGGGQIVVAVFTAIAALSLRFDANRATEARG